MYHKYNGITQRLVGANSWQPLSPLTPLPLNKAEAPGLVFATPSHSAKVEVRNASSAAAGGPPEKLLQKMKLFQADNGLPVYIKGGSLDKVLYGLTLGLCVVGVGLSAKMLYELGWKKK